MNEFGCKYLAFKKQMSCLCAHIKNTFSIFALPEGTSTEDD